MRKGKTKQTIGLFLTAAMALSIIGCSNTEETREQNGIDISNLGNSTDAEETSRTSEAPKEAGDKQNVHTEAAACAVTDFGLRLLQTAIEEAPGLSEEDSEENLGNANKLLSPVSVLSALAMTANGAEGDTLREMESTFGITVSELSAYLADYQRALPESDSYKLCMANGIWFTDNESFAVEDDFLQKNEELFASEIHRVPFDDSTLQEINHWVKDNTDGMIAKILDEIPADAVMYLVNALAFDARWQEPYFEYQVQEGEFTREDGTVQKVQMMYSFEGQYLEDAHGTGFLKYYEDEKYAFVALLPEEGMTVTEYVASLTGEKLREILTNPVNVQVNAAVPKYENEYDIEMGDILQKMGIQGAFDGAKADFSGIGSSTMGNIYISRVLHKTFIAVDENGTKAGAATAVEMKAEGAMEMDMVKEVYLNRPFLYLIMDCEEKLPVFLGIVEAVGEL